MESLVTHRPHAVRLVVIERLAKDAGNWKVYVLVATRDGADLAAAKAFAAQDETSALEYANILRDRFEAEVFRR